VTVVSGLLYVESAQALLEGHYALVARALMEARQEVLVSDIEEGRVCELLLVLQQGAMYSSDGGEAGGPSEWCTRGGEGGGRG
jgi:hypothetical protein